MKLFIELCRASPAWLALPTEERQKFLSNVGPLMEQLKTSGTQIISWGYNDAQTPKRAKYDYFGVFKFPDEAAALRYERTFKNAGWYDYFEQVNVLGDDCQYNEILDRLIDGGRIRHL